MNHKRILIIRLGAIGDVIRTLPALRALRANLPRAYLAWAVEDRAASLLKNHPDLNALFIAPRQKWQQRPLSASTLHEAIEFIRRIRREQFDCVLDFHGLFKSGLIAWLSGVKRRIGYSRGFCREANYLFTNEHVSLPQYKINRVEKNLLLIKALGLPITNHIPIIPVSAQDQTSVDALVGPANHTPSQLKVIIHPGSSPQTPYKRWDHRRYARIADIIIHEYRGKVFFAPGKDEQELVKQITGHMIESDYVVYQTATLTDLAEVIRRCDLYIGNDTAPMHLAAFVGTPVIALFGPTDPVENAPYEASRSIVIRKEVSCNPCRNRTCDNLTCMDAIHVEDVAKAVDRILGTSDVAPDHQHLSHSRGF